MVLSPLSRTLALATDAGFATLCPASSIKRERRKMTLDTNASPAATLHLRSLIEAFAGKRLLVIGDMVADEYLIGNPTRISREAPVLILELAEERTVPGGATNVAVNAGSLGAEVFLTGVVGDDLPGQRLRQAIS